MNSRKRIQLLHLCSNVFPTGIFSHSFGYEMMLEDGRATDMETYEQYLTGILQMGGARAETAVVRFVYEQPERIQEWDELCTALKAAKELRMASSKTGKAFLRTFHKMYPDNPLKNVTLVHTNYCVVFGSVCRFLEIPVEEMLEAYLTSSLLSYIQVGIKLIPLSQMDGQLLMYRCYPQIEKCVEEAMKAKEDICSFNPVVDIASMRHEIQFSRMYMS